MLGGYIIPKSVKRVDATRVPVLAAAFKPFRLVSCSFSFDKWLLNVPQLSVNFFLNRFVQLISFNLENVYTHSKALMMTKF